MGNNEEPQDHIRPGVLSKAGLLQLIEEGVIKGTENTKKDVGPSAFDLHLTNKIWEVKGGIKGHAKHDYVKFLSADYGANLKDCHEPIILKPKSVYVIQLSESLCLKKRPNIVGFATGKSSIGRLDVLTRLIADRSELYDTVRCYQEQDPDEIKLYVEVCPITFGIKIKEGISLNQMRLFVGDPTSCRIQPTHLKYYGHLLLDRESNPITQCEQLESLSVNLTPDKAISDDAVAFCAKGNPDNPEHIINLTTDDTSLNPNDFWTIKSLEHNRNVSEGTLEIKPDAFYIIRSNERLHLPQDVAVYCQAMSENLGEIRVHYAGFAHPHFGNNEKGTPLIFEVRGHNITTFLRDKEVLAKLEFYRMSEPATPDNSVYERQELKLSKYFKDWETS
ncbi:MAG: 2'-deoxycytidine 5'-triphosphate deaminase [Candidatus Pacebacteria bacterium]|nr:2'-deoxycytidine 5'-triphosphate deaminase [Candidatus Paceibacterota bacterium]